MIKSKKGMTTLDGTAKVLEADLFCIIRSFRDTISKNINPEIAEEMIERAYKLSKMTEEEFRKEMEEKYGKP